MEAERVTFCPPLYMQRYSKVLEILSTFKPKQIVDFGCAECKLIQLLKREEYVEEITGVDIDRAILEFSRRKIEPLTADYINPRSSCLTINLMKGSVLEVDERLKCYDAVTCVELIEHLMPNQLDDFKENVFGFIQPALVVISTPNADFNELFHFHNRKEFRHWDHKFEWTRMEFHLWCNDVASSYSYSVKFDGVGSGPAGSEHLGHCSQIAIFTRDTLKACDITSNCQQSNMNYTVIATSVHPHRTEAAKYEDKVLINLHSCTYSIVCACISAIQASPGRPTGNSVPNGFNSNFTQNLNLTNRLSNQKNVESQFENAVDEEVIGKDSRNTYAQETHPVVALPVRYRNNMCWHRLSGLYFNGPQFLPCIGQFDDAELPAEGKSKLIIGGKSVSLASFNSELPFTLIITDIDVTDESFLYEPTVLYTNATTVRIPVECATKLEEMKDLDCCSSKLIAIMKHRNPESITLCDNQQSILVDLYFNDDSEDIMDRESFSDTSWPSNDDSFGGQILSVDKFHEEYWDSD